MCAIIGFHTDGEVTEGQRERLRALFRESQVRGMHAYGAAWLEGAAEARGLNWAKATKLEGLLAGLPMVRTLIGHCRYSTSGDWREERNNQPVTRPELALVFNGIVHMGTKAEMEAAAGFALETENDGEIVARWIEGGEDYPAKLAAWRATYAGLVLIREGASIFRNEGRPAWFAREGEAVYVASTEDIFRRAGFEKAWKVPAGKVVTLHELHE